jgi:hypothetical protein
MPRKLCIQQHDITDCGAACLATVAWYHDLKLPISRILLTITTDFARFFRAAACGNDALERKAAQRPRTRGGENRAFRREKAQKMPQTG